MVIPLTRNLGKYLGIPLIHERVSKLTFAPLLDKACSRLSNWRSHFLNIAGKAILINSVLSAIPNYSMQTMLLPNNVLTELERNSRNFLWDSFDGHKKSHLLSWDCVSKEKSYGGLGIKKLKAQNITFIMKLCWGLITQPNRLWVRILHNKYKCLKPTIPMVYKPSSSSFTWNSICKVWDQFMAHVGWKVGKGDQISFWYSKWSPLPEPLVKYAFSSAEHILHASVSDLCNPTGGWNFNLLNRHLHPKVIRQIALVQPPNPSGDDDVLIWRPSSDGNFSIKSAYKAVVSQKDQTNNSI